MNTNLDTAVHLGTGLAPLCNPTLRVIGSEWNWSPKLCSIDHGQRRPIIDHETIIFSLIKIWETAHSIKEA